MRKSIMAGNLRLLRSLRHLNQNELADALDIRRHRIASYETQNVEPRIELLSKMSSFFQIGIDDLITRKITLENYPTLKAAFEIRMRDEDPVINGDLFNIGQQEIDDFVQKNVQIKKMVEGLKAYYTIKGKDSEISPESRQLMYVLEYLLDANRTLIAEFERGQRTIL
jgi:transcriptional regulator with XRE-family HTH domain